MKKLYPQLELKSLGARALQSFDPTDQTIMTGIRLHMATALTTCLLFLICTCCLNLETSEASPQDGRWPGEHHWEGHRGRRMGGHRGHRGHGRGHGPPGQSRSDEYWSDEDEPPPPPPPPGWGRGRGHRNRPRPPPPRDWRDENRPPPPPPDWEDRHRPPPQEWQDRHRPPPLEWGNDNNDNDRATPQTPPTRFPVISPTPPPTNSGDTLITGKNPPPLPVPLPTDKPDPYWSELRNIIFPNSLEYVQQPNEVESNQLLDVRRR